MTENTEKEHIIHAIVAKKHPSLYLIHRYRARKPHNVVNEYIRCYSKENDIIMDPFCGSGVVAIEGVSLGRKVIAIDLNPLATFITRTSLIPVDLKDLDLAFKEVEKVAKQHIYELYKTKCKKGHPAITLCSVLAFIVKCPNCEKEISMDMALRPKGQKQNIYICPHCGKAFNYAKLDIKGEKPTKIHYYCEVCNKEEWRDAIQEDLANFKKLENAPVPYWHPDLKLSYPTGKRFMTRRRGESFADLFDRRNLIALSILWHAIQELAFSEDIKDVLKLAFSAMLEIVSKLNPFRPPKSTKSGWTVHEYWIPAVHALNNVWDAFVDRFKRVRKGKARKFKLKEAKSFTSLKNDANFLVKTCSALDLSFIPSNSVDYVFTDPPYGGSIQYYELDAFRLAWLRGEHGDQRFNLDWWKDEITINPQQNKSFDYYHTLLSAAFKEIFRVLKPGAYMTVTFHSTDVKVYNSIIRAGVYAGFKMEHIIYQPPAVRSAKASLHPYTSASGDYYIRFLKPEEPRQLPTEQEVDMMRFETVVVNTVKEIIAKRGEPTSYNDILKGIYIELDKYGYLLAARPENIEKILRKHEGKEFIFVENEGWWFKDPSKYLLHIVPLQDRVEIAILQALKKRPLASFDDILQEIFISFRNALTPNPPRVRAILEEYAEQTDGKWRLKDVVKTHETIHTRIIGILAELGKILGYRIWVGAKEQKEIYKNKPLADYCDFKELSVIGVLPHKLNYIQQIDLLWIKEGKISWAFEVEYTTAITEAFNRCSNIPEDHGAKKVIVIPKEREGLLFKKLNSDLLRERAEKEGWRCIFFKDVEELANMMESKKIHDVTVIESLLKTPIEMRTKQEILDSYFQAPF